MDVLIVERDELVRSVLAETVDAVCIPATVAADEDALKLPSSDAPQLVITGINRGRDEDLRGLEMVATLRRKWPQLCAIYLAALWPARLRREKLAAGERFLTKPVSLSHMIRTVRELLDSGLCRSQARSRPRGEAERAGLPTAKALLGEPCARIHSAETSSVSRA